MASTGMALKGKFDVTWQAGTGTLLNIERTGDCALPDTIDNDTVELISNKATRKDVAEKTGYQDATVTCFFNPETYSTLLADKEAGTLGTVSYIATASDGGAMTASYAAKVMGVAGASGSVEGVMESFDATFGIISRISFSGSLGSQAFN